MILAPSECVGGVVFGEYVLSRWPFVEKGNDAVSVTITVVLADVSVVGKVVSCISEVV